VQRIVAQPGGGRLDSEPGKAKLVETRETVVRAWHVIAEKLLIDGHGRLAEQVWKFIGEMPPVATDNERIARGLQRGATREEQRTREISR
jgi:hypothetical protein